MLFRSAETIIPVGQIQVEAGINYEPLGMRYPYRACGGVGGVVNALLSDNGFVLPTRRSNVLCPGIISNVLVGALAAFSSWAFYGSGASVELTQLSERTEISLRFSALAGAFFVGVAGARWITNEADKMLLRESVKKAASKHLSPEDCEKFANASPTQVLEAVEKA